MEGLEVAVVTAPDRHVVDEIDQLLDRVTRTTGHSALSEHKRIALSRTVDRSEASAGESILFVGVLARLGPEVEPGGPRPPVSYTHLRAHETVLDLVCRLLLEK